MRRIAVLLLLACVLGTGCDKKVDVDVLLRSPAQAAGRAPVADAPAPAAGNPFVGRSLYVEPVSYARTQANAWRSTRPADAAVMARLGNQPAAKWFGGWSGDIAVATDQYVTAAAAARALPVLVAYNIPQRDCGGWSAGGVATADAYRSWIGAFARGIGDRPAVVILEPDALAHVTCLNPADQATRLSLLRDAVTALEARPGVSVYIDAGNPVWVPVDQMAARLTSVGVAGAEGFALNVSNYHPTATSVVYAKELSARIGGKRGVIDTSRNGAGSNGEWCNALGRALGPTPTATTADATVDAYLWVKTPGESDGPCNGGPSAGRWWPEYALGLAAKAGF